MAIKNVIDEVIEKDVDNKVGTTLVVGIEAKTVHKMRIIIRNALFLRNALF